MNKKWGNIDPDFDNDNTINGWKLKVLDVEFFRLERPNMSSFDTDEIQTAINSSLALLDAECNGLIQEVWFITDVESKFYRTGKEKNYIREAAIMQTQYFINLGNDYTDGSTSFNASGISASFQRPLDKKNIAPGVFILLQKGRVYELQSYDLGGNNFGKKPTANSLVNYVQFGVGDVRYVSYNQMPYNRQEGSLLYVEKGEIKFFTVEQLDLTVPRAYLLWDKATKSFEDIHDVKDIAFFGNQLDNAITRQEAEELIAASPSGVSKEYVDDGLNLKANKTDIDTINVELEVNSTNISDNAANIANKQDKLIAGTNITIVGDTISSSGGTTNGVTLDTDQTITGEKTFTKAITINSEDGKKYFFDTNTVGGLTFSAPKYIINKVGGKSIIGFYDNGYISCFNNRIIEVGTPTADYDAATKKYVDDNVLLKQDKLTAGTGIDITGDTISSTTVVSPDTALTSKTNTFEFRQVIKSGGSGLLDLQNSTGSVLNTTYDLASTSVKLTSPNTTSMTFTAKDFNFSDKEIKNVGTPITNKSAANKEYVDTKQAKLTAGANITITDNVISSTGGGGGGSGDVTLDTAQNITGIKTFTNGIKNNLVEVDGKSLIIKNSNTSASYLEIESVYSGSGYKNWFGIQLFRTTGTSRPRLANVEIRQDDGLYIACVNDISIQGSNIKFNNVRLQQVGVPTADYDAATKKYVDDGLALKQNKLTAGANITITDNVISASGGGSTPTNMMTTDTAQNITGIKTFTNGIKIDGVTSIKGPTSITGNTLFTGYITAYGQIDMTNENIVNLRTPTADNHAATKKYVDDAIAAALRPYRKES